MKSKLFFISVLFSFLSCDPYVYNVYINDYKTAKNLVFECGRVEFSANIIGYSQVQVFQKFRLNTPISINPHGLHVSYKNHILLPTVYSNGQIIEKITEISGESIVTLVLNVRKIERGDLIKIDLNDYIMCREKPLQENALNLTFACRP